MNARIFKLFLMLVIPFSAVGQRSPGFHITGSLEQMQDGEMVVLTRFEEGWGRTDVDSTIIRNHQFAFTGTLTDGPRTYAIKYQSYYNETTKQKDYFKAIHFLIENGDSIRIHMPDIPALRRMGGFFTDYATVEGSTINAHWNRMLRAHLLYHITMSQYYDNLQKIEDSIGYDRSLVELTLRSRQQVHKAIWELLKNYPPNRAWAWFFYYHRGKARREAVVKQAYDSLTEADQQSFYGRLLKEDADLAVGQPFPVCTLPTPEGKPLSLKTVIESGKLTLVHFWSGQSYKVDNLQKELAQYYRMFQGRGLNVVSVYLDKYAEQWKEELQRRQLPGYQVSDLKGEEGVANTLYHARYALTDWERKVPAVTNVLVDQQGKIVAWAVSGAELRYWLESYLGVAP